MSNPRIPRKPGQPANSKKHSDLYTDENPKGTIHGLGFKDVATAKASVSKIRNSSRSHAHKIQAAVAMEQRAREMGKTSEASVYRKFINSMKKKTKEMNEEMNGKCKSGYYYCYTDKKCKKIPMGYHVGGRGMLEKDTDESETKKNGNGNNQNGNGNGNGNSNGGSNGGGVSEGTLHKWFKGSKSKDGKGGWVNVVTGGTCASDEPGEGTPKCVSSAKRASMSKKERLSAARRKKAADPGQQQKSGAAKPTYVSTDKKKKVKEDIELTDAYGETFAVVQDVIETKPMESKVPPIESYETYDLEAMTEGKDKKGKGSGTKDACYHKVKSRYSVWPSAYASGALVKCRKVGAANWGNKSEEVEIDEKCWDGYEKKGMKTMFGKRYPNCVKKKKTSKEEVSHENELRTVETDLSHVNEASTVKRQTGNIIQIIFGWRGKTYQIKMFFPQLKKPNRKEIETELNKAYPDSKIWSFNTSELVPGQPFLHVNEDWQKKSGKNPEGGLNEKGRKSYERENPGSDLKRPSKKVGNPRRASFCARMKGMKKKLTSAKTANDPDSRINKSLRAWNC